MAFKAQGRFSEVSNNAICFSELCLKLSNSESSFDELIEYTGLGATALRRWLKLLHDRKLIYICERRRTANVGARKLIWTWNTDFQHEDVPKPKPEGDAVWSERYRQKQVLRVLNNLGANSNVR